MYIFNGLTNSLEHKNWAEIRHLFLLNKSCFNMWLGTEFCQPGNYSHSNDDILSSFALIILLLFKGALNATKMLP